MSAGDSSEAIAPSGGGYLEESYARSLAQFGSPLELPGCGGWILKRSIPQSGSDDGMGCYPLFACRDWSKLSTDLNALQDRLVTVTMVTDPFGEYDATLLERTFVDLVRPFKQHFVTDLAIPPDSIVSAHHRYYSRRALAALRVDLVEDPVRFVDEWLALYSCLIERHELSGLRAFSREAFERQLQVPGLVVMRATEGGTTVGAHLWYVQGAVAYSHLTAFNPRGYERMAAYALYRSALDYFTGRVAWLDLGSGAGGEVSPTDGLSRFKQGWASETRTAYLCGRILQPEVYRKLGERADASTRYFPAYRAGELA